MLGWGEKTLTRYEGHQVQDKSNDTILRRLDADPEWFLRLLENVKGKISETFYNIYAKKVAKLYEERQDSYLQKAIEAVYAGAKGNVLLDGGTSLSLS